MSRIKEQAMLIETNLFGPLKQAGMYQGFDKTVHINGKNIGPNTTKYSDSCTTTIFMMYLRLGVDWQAN